MAMPPVALQSCVSALGRAPVVNSIPALHHFAAQLHTLITPLPTPQTHAQLTSLEGSVQGSLERLDELSALLEALKHNSSQVHSEVMPLLLARQADLQPLFQRIHTFAKYTSALENQLSEVEKRVGAVEQSIKHAANMDAGGKIALGQTGAGNRGEEDALAKAERGAKKLFSSFLSLGSSSKSPALGATPSPASSSSSSEPQLLDLIDTWVPFDHTMPPVDIEEWFGPAKPKKAAAATTAAQP